MLCRVCAVHTYMWNMLSCFQYVIPSCPKYVHISLDSSLLWIFDKLTVATENSPNCCFDTLPVLKFDKLKGSLQHTQLRRICLLRKAVRRTDELLCATALCDPGQMDRTGE